MSLSMNVPNWDNAGVSPSDEKKQKGYAAGEYLPAQHLNWFINQTFTNLAAAKDFINQLEASMPCRVISGTYTGTGQTFYEDIISEDPRENPDPITQTVTAEDVTINIGVTPSVVFLTDNNANSYKNSGATYIITPSYFYKKNDDYTANYTVPRYIVGINDEKYTAETENALLIVADTATPTENEVKISTVQSACVSKIIVTENTNVIADIDVSNVAVGDYVVFANKLLQYQVKRNSYTKIVENGFMINQFNDMNKKYAYVALINY